MIRATAGLDGSGEYEIEEAEVKDVVQNLY